ncbi:MAG: hypothetical protein ACJ77E_00760 [Gaiellaceae bacterium]
MKRALLAAAGGIVLALACAGGAARANDAQLRVLFIGKSLTAVNDLPHVVSTLSGGRIAYKTVAPGGVSLEDHWTLTGARDALEEGPWDFVVLQQGPSSLADSAANLREWTVRWADAIRTHHATPAVYEVWPESAFGVRASFPAIVHSYRRAAAAAHATFLPAGEAWQAAWRRDPRLALYGPDGFHPSQLGTTLAALVITARLTGTPAGRVPLPYPAKIARLLRAAAAEAIKGP